MEKNGKAEPVLYTEIHKQSEPIRTSEQNGVGFKPDSKVDREDDKTYYPGQEKEGKFGWLGFHPRWLQFMNNATGYLVIYGIFLTTQGMLTNGLNNVILSTLERRFRLQSSETGLIVVSYDIAYFVLCLFVTFYGNRAHGPRLLGLGSLLYGLGSLLFALPHFTTDQYKYEGNVSDLCDPTYVESCEVEEGGEDLHAYLGVFIVAMVIQGFACTPLFTVGFAIIENSVPKGKSALYMGLANALTILGPVLGYLLGGYLLTVYVDFDTTSPDEIPLSPDDPRWVGAWWVGCLVAAAMAWGLVSLPMLGFPQHLPGSAKVRAQKESEVPANAGEEITEKSDFGRSIKDMPISTWTMLKNPTFLFTTFGSCSDGFAVAAFTAFLPKYIENQFNITAGMAAAYSGAIAIPGGILGTIIASVVVKRFDLRIPQVLKMCSICAGIVLLLSPILLVHCDNSPVAGVNVPYNDSGIIPSPANLTSQCNAYCGCQEKYFTPVCGDGGLNYFSPCFAGCTTKDTVDGKEVFRGCSCVENGQVVAGFCGMNCNKIGPFMAVFFIVVLVNFMPLTPVILVIFRCVPDSQKSYAIGLQNWIVRLLGSIPGPILFGVIFDATCMLWEQLSCGDGTGSCWIHNSRDVGVYLLIPSFTCKLLSIVFFSLASYFYKPPPVTGEGFLNHGADLEFDETEKCGKDASGYEIRREGDFNQYYEEDVTVL